MITRLVYMETKAGLLLVYFKKGMYVGLKLGTERKARYNHSSMTAYTSRFA